MYFNDPKSRIVYVNPILLENILVFATFISVLQDNDKLLDFRFLKTLSCPKDKTCGFAVSTVDTFN